MVKMVQPSANVQKRINEKEDQTNNLNFAYSFRPVYYILRFLSLMPFTITYDLNGEVQKCAVTKFDVLWIGIPLSMYLLMTSYMEILTHLPPVLLLGTELGILIFTHNLLTILVNMYNRYRFIDILKKITNFDKEVTFSFYPKSTNTHSFKLNSQ